MTSIWVTSILAAWFAAAAETRPAVVAFGDSLSAGYGAEAGKSYPDFLQKLIDAKGYKFRVVNAGVSGDTTTDGVERLRDVLGVHPSVVILEFGGNDGLRGLPVAGTKENLAQIIQALQKNGTEVVLAGMTLPRNYGPDYIHSFEKIYVDLAQQYKLVRIPFLLDKVAGGPATNGLMQQDSIHPTAKGNAMVADTVFRYVEPILRRSKSSAH